MRRILCIMIILTVTYSCKKPYSPPVDEETNSILVVEGTIAAGVNAENRYLLSRLRPLLDTTINEPETGAKIVIEGQGGQNWTLTETSAGDYRSTISLPLTSSYKLKIQTRSGKQYETDFLAVKSTPPIDSVTWSQPEKDAEIYVHTHDPSNNTRYYRWEFSETWEYHSFFDSNLKYENGRISFLPDSLTNFACWSSAYSGSIILGNTTALSEDKVSYQPILVLPNASPKASFKYSINVKQVALTVDAYNFWTILRKNTELTGTLFDPQPSQLPGNIKSITNPGERVIGYVSVGAVSEKRLYIRNAELFQWPQRPAEDSVCKTVDANPDPFAFLDRDTTYGPAYFLSGALLLAKKNCMDCRRRGGSTVRPAFWQ